MLAVRKKQQQNHRQEQTTTTTTNTAIIIPPTTTVQKSLGGRNNSSSRSRSITLVLPIVGSILLAFVGVMPLIFQAVHVNMHPHPETTLEIAILEATLLEKQQKQKQQQRQQRQQKEQRVEGNYNNSNHNSNSNSNSTQTTKRPYRFAIVTYYQQNMNKLDSVTRAVIQCTVRNKQAYAARHGYEYLDEHDFDAHQALPLLPHMTKGGAVNKARYRKLQVLIQFLEKKRHSFSNNLDWFLWIDADALITDMDIKLEDRMQEFETMHAASAMQKQHEQEQKHGNNTINKNHLARTMTRTTITTTTIPQLSMVLCRDHNDTSWNTGVFFIRNNDVGRRILHTAYATYVNPHDSWADQRALIHGVLDNNHTMLNQHILSLSAHQSYLLQQYRYKKLSPQKPMYWREWHNNDGNNNNKNNNPMDINTTTTSTSISAHNHGHRRPFSLHVPNMPYVYRKKVLFTDTQLCRRGSSNSTDGRDSTHGISNNNNNHHHSHPTME